MMKHLMIAGILSCFSMGGFAQIYKDKTAPVEDRTNDLLHRMTLEEKLDYIKYWEEKKKSIENEIIKLSRSYMHTEMGGKLA